MKAKRNTLERLKNRALYKTYKAPNGCWIWRRGLIGDGYASSTVDGKHVLVHRIMYELTYGAIPEGYVIHHKCKQRSCVNPVHLEAMSNNKHSRLQRGTKQHDY